MLANSTRSKTTTAHHATTVGTLSWVLGRKVGRTAGLTPIFPKPVLGWWDLGNHPKKNDIQDLTIGPGEKNI